MTTKIILIALVVVGLSSCSTAYKLQQTPDDVYYSPAPPQNVYVQVNNEEDRNVYSSEDREIRRRVNNRRWRNRSYDYGYGYPYPYGYYPYGSGYGYPVYVDPATGTPPSTYKGPRKYNLGTYSTPTVTTRVDPKTGKVITVPNRPATTVNGTPARTFSRPPASNRSGVGNLLRRVFTEPAISTRPYNNGNATQSRSFEPARSSSTTPSAGSRSSSGSSSGATSAPVRTFKK